MNGRFARRLARLHVIVLGVIAVAVGFPSSAGAATGFLSPEEYETVAADRVVARDMNEDGHDDMVSVGGGQLSVRLGDEEGGFGAATDFPVPGADLGELAVGDVDGDGHDDAVVNIRESEGIFLLLGDGAGGFESKTQVGTVPAPGGIALGDFDQDGSVDIAVTKRLYGSVQTLMQDPTGEFTPGLEIDVDGSDPYAIEAEDLDQDGRVDLVTANVVSDDVSVMLQTLDGFQEATSHEVGAHPGALLIADLDDEGTLDIATADYLDSTVSVLSAESPGAFDSRSVQETGPFPSSLAAVDLDADGDMDLVNPFNFIPGIAVLLQDGGGFETVYAGDGYSGSLTRSLSVGRFDDDGEPDLLLAAADKNVIGVLFGDVLNLQPGMIDFGWLPAGWGSEEYLTVRNTGTQPIAPGLISLQGDAQHFSVSSDDCEGRTLAPRESCDLIVGFSVPENETADFAASIKVAGDSASGPRVAQLIGSSTATPPPSPDEASPRAPGGTILPIRPTRPRLGLRTPRLLMPKPMPKPMATVDSFAIKKALDRLARRLPRMLGQGSRRVLRLPAFQTTAPGYLRFRLKWKTRNGNVTAAAASAKVRGGQPHRLRFRFTAKGRKLLMRRGHAQLRARFAFRPTGHPVTFQKKTTFTISRP